MRWNKKPSIKSDKTETTRTPKRGVVGYSRKSALLEEAITQMNAGKYGRSSAALKELLALDPVNMEARRLFATLHLRLGSLIPAREAFDTLIAEALQRQDYWLTESLLREYLAAGPRCVPYLEKLGMIYQEKGNVLEAVEEYGKAVDILIEDPDPERPDYAGRLYAKIRELAPASPVAFRLASFFDAETGELVPRQLSASETTTLPQDVAGEDSREQTVSARAVGAMPWEIQVPSEGLEPSAELSHSLEIAQPATQSENSAASLSQSPSSDQKLTPSGKYVADQAEPIDIEAQTDGLRAVSTHDIGAVLAGGEIKRFIEQEPVKDTPPTPNSVNSTVDIPLLPLEANPGAAAADSSVVFQVTEQGPTETQDAIAALEACTAPEAIRVDSEQIAGPSVSFLEEFAEPSLPTPPQFDEEPPTLSLKTEPSPSESIPAPNKEEVLFKTNEVEKFQAEERCSPIDSSITPAQVSADEITQPWKQPGFSWKSVFDTAWKLGEQSQAKDVSTPTASNHLNENVGETPSVPSSQARLIEDSILKREGESQKKDEETLRSPIATMPWDQVQEAVLSITPVQTSLSIAESIEPSEDPLQDQDRTLQIDDSPPQTAPLTIDSHPATDSVVLSQDAPIMPSEERHDIAAATSAPPTTAENTDQVVESEPAFSFVRSSPVEESVSFASPTPELQPSTQGLGISSLVDLKEDRGEPTEVVIERGQARTGTVHEEIETSPKAEFQTHLSQPIDEVLGEKVEIVRDIASAPIERSETTSIIDEREVLFESQGASQALPHDDQPPEVVNVHTRNPIPEPMPPSQVQMEPDASTRVSRTHTATSGISAAMGVSEQQEVNLPLPEAPPADVFTESSRIRKVPETRTRAEEPPPSKKSAAILKGIGTALTDFLRTGFSTTQAIVTTVVGVSLFMGICFGLGVGALALTWMIMEEPPSPIFQSFTTTPQQTLSGARANAYTLLVGIEAPVGQDPLHVGVERQAGIADSTTALGCFGTPEPEIGDRSSASDSAMRGWVRGSDPIGQFKSHQETIQGWSSQQHVVLERYRQWQKLPFEDWGYGQPVSPPCGAMIFAHRLHVADGFVQATDMAVDRLETDMEMWRVVLSQARTLPVKMLALQAINDDIAVASGMLVRSDFDTKHLGRITKFVRPFDQAELSLRWPMQSELVSAGKTYESQLKAARAEGQALSAMVLSALPLPKQRRLNDYAKYYEVSYQATGEKQYGSLPKWKDYVRFPATGVMDYLANPIENLVGVDPLPAWDLYNGMIVDTDAHLRLASLQAWLRRGFSEGDLPNKIAKAGQDFYDPYTGLPMLVNQKRGMLYSVGHDGKDQDADPQADVVVEIPFASTSANQAKSYASSSKSR